MLCMTDEHSQLPFATRTAVVIPHLNRLEDTSECCRSLAKQTRKPSVIFVVDNASQAHTEEELSSACPNAQIIRLNTNRGFAGGVNTGIRMALAINEIGYIWVLNNDTFSPPDTLENLITAAEADSRIGLVGCPLLEGEKGFPLQKVPAGKDLKRPWAVPVQAQTDSDPYYLSGASLCIKRALLEDIGLFDEGFFFFFEDADFSQRTVQQGWHLSVAMDASVEHRGSSTIRRMSELQARSYRAGHIRYLRKHSRHPFLFSLPPFIFRLAANLIQFRLKAIRGNWRGWQDGWRMALPAQRADGKSITAGCGKRHRFIH